MNEPDFSLMDKYLKEIMDFNKKGIGKNIPEEEKENLTEESFLKVKVYSGNEAFPVENAKVIIKKEGILTAFLITDKLGETNSISLKAPKRENTLESQNDNKETVYTADIYSENFLPLKNLYISQVGGGKSILKVNLIPMPEGGRN